MYIFLRFSITSITTHNETALRVAKNAVLRCSYRLRLQPHVVVYVCVCVRVMQMPGWPEPHNGSWLLQLFPVVVPPRFFESCSARYLGGRFKPIIRADSAIRTRKKGTAFSRSSMVSRNIRVRKKSRLRGNKHRLLGIDNTAGFN